MSTGTDGPLGDTDGATAQEREEVLALLEDGIREAHRKVKNGRIRNAENEKAGRAGFASRRDREPVPPAEERPRTGRDEGRTRSPEIGDTW